MIEIQQQLEYFSAMHCASRQYTISREVASL